MKTEVEPKLIALCLPDFAVRGLREQGTPFLHLPLTPQPYFPTVASDGQEGIYGVVPVGRDSLRYKTNGDTDSIRYKPIYCPGDTLVIREAYALGEVLDGMPGKHRRYYRADGAIHSRLGPPLKWRSAAEMPIEESRFRLEVMSSAVIRVNDAELLPLPDYPSHWNQLYGQWKPLTRSINRKRRTIGYVCYPWDSNAIPSKKKGSTSLSYQAYPNPWVWRLQVKTVNL